MKSSKCRLPSATIHGTLVHVSNCVVGNIGANFIQWTTVPFNIVISCIQRINIQGFSTINVSENKYQQGYAPSVIVHKFSKHKIIKN